MARRRYDWQGPGFMLRGLARLHADGEAQWLAQRIDTARAGSEMWLATRKPNWRDLVWYDPGIPAQAPDPSVVCYVASDLGSVFARTDWSDEAAWLMFKVGPVQGQRARDRGVGPGGHEHPDVGHVSYFAGGQWILEDDGYSRVKDSALHSVWSVDGKPQSGSGKRWMRVRDAAAPGGSLLASERRDGFFVARGRVDSAYPGGPGATIHRQVAMAPDGALLVVDFVATPDAGRVEGQFVFARDLEATPDGFVGENYRVVVDNPAQALRRRSESHSVSSGGAKSTRQRSVVSGHLGAGLDNARVTLLLPQGSDGELIADSPDGARARLSGKVFAIVADGELQAID